MEKILLYEFWNWLGMSPSHYAEITKNDSGYKNDLEEYMFPQWAELMDKAESIINEGLTDEDSLEFILISMAIDNEEENILDYISRNGNEKFIIALVNKGIRYYQSHSRWQIAELLGRRHLKGWKSFLQILINDSDLYVSKRAQNILCL